MSTQLRLGFSTTPTPIVVDLTLAGLVVLAESYDCDDEQLVRQLNVAGIQATHDQSGVRFDVDQVLAAYTLPEHITLRPDDALTPLLTLVTHPSDDNIPADVTLAADGSVELSWVSAGESFRFGLPGEAATALLSADIAFVASAAAFDALAKLCRLPLLVGRAHVNLDGFVEIVSSKPQLVEAAPIPGLFRLDATRLGCPLPYASVLDSLPGFRWSTPPPPPDEVPDVADELPMPLSAHAAADVQHLVTSLSQWKAQAVVWPGGLGRRVFVTAALAALDAWPALVVCHPEHVWLWLRHSALAARTAAVGDMSGDIHVVTYAQLAATGGWPRAVQAVVFDSPASVVNDPAVIAAASRLGSLAHAYRVVVASSWPHDVPTQLAVMKLLRPAEFVTDVAVPVRYPPDSYERFAQHVQAYVSTRSESGERTLFRRSTVTVLPPVPAQEQAWERIRGKVASAPALTLSSLLEVTSAGPEYATSPKVAAAVAAANTALSEGARVVIVTRHSRTAQLVNGLLRGRGGVIVTDASSLNVLGQGVRLVIGKFDRVWPDLTRFDHVIVMDWPWSLRVLEDAVGSSASPVGPAVVQVLHTPGSLDDRLVLAAAHRQGPDTVSIAGPPSPAETAWLLATTTV